MKGVSFSTLNIECRAERSIPVNINLNNVKIVCTDKCD